MKNNINIGDIVRLDYNNRYIIFVKVEKTKKEEMRFNIGIWGYLIQYIDYGNHPILKDLIHTDDGYYCAYTDCKVLNNMDDVMVELL